MLENLVDGIIDLDTASENLRELVEEVVQDHTQKVIISNNKPSALLVNVNDYQDMQDRLLAMELELGLRKMLEEEKRGELLTLEDLSDG